MGGGRKRWDDMEPGQRRAVVFVGAITSALQLLMLWDLWRRPAEQVRGSKRAWVAASFVRPLGQVAYVLWGRSPRNRNPDELPEKSRPRRIIGRI